MTLKGRYCLLTSFTVTLVGCGGRSDMEIDFDVQANGGDGSSVGGSTAAPGLTGGSRIGAGGAMATGGRSRGIGGAIPATGGTKGTGGWRASGGKTASGGYPATGGTYKLTGGVATAGGSRTSGGYPPTGGKGGAGGTTATGGIKATGGQGGFGGIIASGGTKATGGFGGAIATGGTKATGGVGGTIVTGGATASGGSAAGGVLTTGGYAPTGGTTGSGGSSTCPSYLTSNEELVDDLDDGNAAILELNGRRGAWSDLLVDTSGASMVPDPSAPFFVTDTGDVCRKYSVYVHGKTSINPGAGANFGFSLGSPYDASQYTGLSFWAKIDAGTNPPVRVTFPDGDTDPRGAICSTSSADPSLQCWSHFGYRLVLSTAWTKYVIPFKSLTQDPWGYQAASFDPTRLYSVTFTIGDTDTFAIWIDSVAFTY